MLDSSPPCDQALWLTPAGASLPTLQSLTANPSDVRLSPGCQNRPGCRKQQQTSRTERLIHAAICERIADLVGFANTCINRYVVLVQAFTGVRGSAGEQCNNTHYFESVTLKKINKKATPPPCSQPQNMLSQHFCINAQGRLRVRDQIEIHTTKQSTAA